MTELQQCSISFFFFVLLREESVLQTHVVRRWLYKSSGLPETGNVVLKRRWFGDACFLCFDGGICPLDTWGARVAPSLDSLALAVLQSMHCYQRRHCRLRTLTTSLDRAGPVSEWYHNPASEVTAASPNHMCEAANGARKLHGRSTDMGQSEVDKGLLDEQPPDEERWMFVR